MEIKEIKFEPKQYLVIRKKISTKQITDKDMYDHAFHKLVDYLVQKNTKPAGAPSVLIFLWDEPNQKAEIGISFPVSGIDSVNDPELSIVNIPESKAVMSVLQGDYSGIGFIHGGLRKYLEDNKLKYADLAIEEYVSMTGPNTENYVTNIYYFYN